MTPRVQVPKRIWWARPRKLCALERPGGGGRSHRSERREAEIAYLVDKGVRLCVSTMATRHNLADYESAGIEWHHVPVATSADWEGALDEILPLLGERLRTAGAAAVHGNSHTDFIAAVCAAYLDQERGISPVLGLAQAARAGLTVTSEACALLGVVPAEVEEEVEARGWGRGRGRRAA